MNLNFFGVACLILGGLILYGAVKNMYPDDAIRSMFGQDPKHGPIVGVWSSGRTLKPSSTTPGVPVVTV